MINKRYLILCLILTIILTGMTIVSANEDTSLNDNNMVSEASSNNSDDTTSLDYDNTLNEENYEKTDSESIVKDSQKTVKSDGQKSTGIAFSKSYRQANQTVDITATLRSGGVGLAGEKLTIKFNDQVQTFTTDNEGKVNHVYYVTKIGTQIINMTYNGSDEYKACNRTEKFDRLPSDSLIRISLSETACYVDQRIVISTRLVERNETPIPNEPLILNLNGKEYSDITDNNGYVYITFDAKEAGIYNFTVNHEVNEKYAASYNYKNFEVYKWGTADLIWTKYDSTAETLHVRITLFSHDDKVPGEVMRLALNDNETEVMTDENAVASTIFKLQDRGEQTLYINFDETRKYRSHNRTKTFSSYTYNTTLETTADKTAKVGQVIPITAQLNYTTVDNNNRVNYSYKISNEPVTISINGENFTGKTDNKGQFTVNYTPTKAGVLSVVSYYNQGQFKFNISQSKKITVNIEDTADSNKILVAIKAPGTMVTGQIARLNISVTDINKKAVNSSVILKVNGLTQKNNDGSVLILDVKNGFASYDLSLAGYSAKKYTLTAVTVDKYHNRTENNTVMNVLRGKCSFTPITVNTTSEGEITINTIVKDSYGKVISGNTQIAIKLGDRTVLTTRITDGKINVKVKVPYLPPGENKFRIILGENYRYESNIINNTLNIHKQDVTATITKITSKAGKKITIKTKLTNKETKTNVIGGKYSYKLDGKTITTSNNLQVSDSIAQLEYTLPENIKTGKHSIMIVYAGNTQSNPLRYTSDALTIT